MWTLWKRPPMRDLKEHLMIKVIEVQALTSLCTVPPTPPTTAGWSGETKREQVIEKHWHIPWPFLLTNYIDYGCTYLFMA